MERLTIDDILSGDKVEIKLGNIKLSVYTGKNECLIEIRMNDGKIYQTPTTDELVEILKPRMGGNYAEAMRII